MTYNKEKDQAFGFYLPKETSEQIKKYIEIRKSTCPRGKYSLTDFFYEAVIEKIDGELELDLYNKEDIYPNKDTVAPEGKLVGGD